MGNRRGLLVFLRTIMGKLMGIYTYLHGKECKYERQNRQKGFKSDRRSHRKKENLTGAIFIAPYLIGYIIFQGLPFLIAMILGFTNVRYISKLDDATFVGLENFIRMFNDMDTMKALGRTGLYSSNVCSVNYDLWFLYCLYGKQRNPF